MIITHQGQYYVSFSGENLLQLLVYTCAFRLHREIPAGPADNWHILSRGVSLIIMYMGHIMHVAD